MLGMVTYLTGLAFGLGPAVGRAGYSLLLWTYAVLIGQADGGDPPATAAGLATDHATSAPGERLAGTIIGIMLAFAGMALLALKTARHSPGPSCFV